MPRHGQRASTHLPIPLIGNTLLASIKLAVFYITLAPGIVSLTPRLKCLTLLPFPVPFSLFAKPFCRAKDRDFRLEYRTRETPRRGKANTLSPRLLECPLGLSQPSAKPTNRWLVSGEGCLPTNTPSPPDLNLASPPVPGLLSNQPPLSSPRRMSRRHGGGGGHLFLSHEGNCTKLDVLRKCI